MWQLPAIGIQYFKHHLKWSSASDGSFKATSSQNGWSTFQEPLLADDHFKTHLQLRTATTRSNKKQHEATRSNKKQQEATSSNKQQQEATRSNKKQQEATRNNKKQQETTTTTTTKQQHQQQRQKNKRQDCLNWWIPMDESCYLQNHQLSNGSLKWLIDLARTITSNEPL